MQACNRFESFELKAYGLKVVGAILCRQAQEDALSALAACTKGYGSATMAQHLPKIWDALRSILMAPSDSDLAPEDRMKARFTAPPHVPALHAPDIPTRSRGIPCAAVLEEFPVLRCCRK